MRDDVADARREDDADEHGDEGHERQDRLDHRVDGLAAGLVEDGDDAAHELPDLRHEASLLLRDFLRGVVVTPADAARCRSIFCCRLRFWCPLDRLFCSICKGQVLLAHRRDVDVRLDVLRERAARASRVEVDGLDTLLRVDAAAQRAAAVDDDSEDLVVGDARLEAVDELAARHLSQPFGDGRDDAARDIDDLVLLCVRVQLERAAEAAGTSRDDDVFILCHDALLPFHMSHMFI